MNIWQSELLQIHKNALQMKTIKHYMVDLKRETQKKLLVKQEHKGNAKLSQVIREFSKM